MKCDAEHKGSMEKIEEILRTTQQISTNQVSNVNSTKNIRTQHSKDSNIPAKAAPEGIATFEKQYEKCCRVLNYKILYVIMDQFNWTKV